jgi:hypothetical protein
LLILAFLLQIRLHGQQRTVEKLNIERGIVMDSIVPVYDQPLKTFASNTQAIIEFSRIWAEGCRNISDIMVTATQAHFDHVTDTLKAMGDAKTIKGAMGLQMAATRTSIEQAVVNSNKLSNASISLANQGFAPLKARMDIAASSFAFSTPDLP